MNHENKACNRMTKDELITACLRGLQGLYPTPWDPVTREIIVYDPSQDTIQISELDMIISNQGKRGLLRKLLDATLTI